MHSRPLILGLALLALAACTTAAQQANIGATGAEYKETTSEKSSSISSLNSASSSSAFEVTERIQSGGILQIGSADAPVSMLLFINHGSDYSQQFMHALLPRLMEDFVSKEILQIGIIPVEFQKYPQSQMSAAMLLCATMQGKGRAMNDLLFTQVNAATIQKQIGAMGLELQRMQDCMKSDKLKNLLIDQSNLAQSFNITLVPSYTLNGAVFTGLPEYADLRGQVEEALK
jgi:protein-disulfide isomerase